MTMGSASGSSTDDDLPLKQRPRNPKVSLIFDSDGSDDAEFSEKGTEVCQVGDEICAVPTDLFDLPDLKGILSLDAWNFCLTEDERESLAALLPAMYEDDFRLSIRQLLGGHNFHFGSPLTELFGRLKDGLCVPRVARYKEGLKYLQRKKHYHLLRQYHNRMIHTFLEMQKSWEDCPQGADIDDRLQIWKSWKAHKSQNLQEKSMKSSARPPVGPWLDGSQANRQEGPVVAGNQRAGSKGVLKMKAVKKGNTSAVLKSGPEREVERVNVPARKGVLKVVPKGLMQSFVKAEPVIREMITYGQPQAPPGSPGALTTVNASKDKSLDITTGMKVEKKKKKRSTGENKRMKKGKEECREMELEIELPEVDGSEKDNVGEELSEDIHEESRQSKKSKAIVEMKVAEEAKGPSKPRKKAPWKTPAQEKKEIMENNDAGENERAGEQWMLTGEDQEGVAIGKDSADVKEEVVSKTSKKKSRKKSKEEKRDVSPVESSPESPEERGASVKSAKK